MFVPVLWPLPGSGSTDVLFRHGSGFGVYFGRRPVSFGTGPIVSHVHSPLLFFPGADLCLPKCSPGNGHIDRTSVKQSSGTGYPQRRRLGPCPRLGLQGTLRGKSPLLGGRLRFYDGLLLLFQPPPSDGRVVEENEEYRPWDKYIYRAFCSGSPMWPL